MLGLSQSDVAGRLGVSDSVISRFEERITLPMLNLDQLHAVFEADGIEFVAGEHGVRKRASGVIRAPWNPPPRKG